MKPPARAQSPKVSPCAVRWFARYARRYLRRHFHALRLSGESELERIASGPLVIYLNHAAWWDPLVCLLVQQALFPGRTGYAPIAANSLQRYPLFSRLGFFGVEHGTWRGAADFLMKAHDVLERTTAILWITPQGQFADVRERPLRFQPGLGHLAARWRAGWIVPLAIEYVFWEERLPEVLLRFGHPLDLSAATGLPNRADIWTGLLERRLERAQDELARDARERASDRFRLLLGGRTGVGVIYDTLRRLRALLTGQPFNPQHGTL